MANTRRNAITATLAVSLLLVGVSYVEGHGRLIKPPSRSTMWRYGFPTPPNYNDMELFCGGFTRQWRVNGGLCGICGDPWDGRQPRENEEGGRYAKGIVVETYEQGQVIDVEVQLTAHHKGHFEFRLCPANEGQAVEVTQQCLDQNQLQLADGSGNRYYLPPGSGTGVFRIQFQLPPQLHCPRCVFQWIYIAGNNWGVCDDGSQRIGCGPQEQFRGCADVSIKESAYPSYEAQPSVDSATTTTTTTPTTTVTTPTTTVTTPSTTTATPVWSGQQAMRCSGAGLWRNVPGMSSWCNNNCLRHQPPFCPPTHCTCY